MRKKISIVFKINWFQFFYYNFLCKSVIRDKKGFLIPYWHSAIQIHKTARLVLHGRLHLNGNLIRGSHVETSLLMREGAEFIVNKQGFFWHGDVIQVHKDAKLEIGEFRMNTGGTLICAKHILIGEGCSCGRGVFIFDSDHHPIFNANGDRINEAKDIIIHDHVWMGLRSTIMKGANIGEGCMIGANSIVASEIPPHVMVATPPGRPVMKDISWQR